MQFFTQRYSELPVEENDGKVPTKPQQRWSKKLVAMVATLVLLISLLAVVGSAAFTHSKENFQEQQQQEELDQAEWLAQATRATTGDQYLLGVGKADITGYVSEEMDEVLN